MDPEVLNIAEAATFLGAHQQTVRRLARRGAIPAFKVGKDWRFRREALLRWSEAQQRPPVSAVQPDLLVVDDEELIGRSLGRIFRQLGWRSRHALSGAEGLDQVAQKVPDLVLLDLKMPHMSGPEFLDRLRVLHPALPVVLLTGYPDSELVQQAMEHAPLLLLSKPVDAGQLERTVRLVLGEANRPIAEQP